jgi:HK97 family phage portal protein
MGPDDPIFREQRMITEIPGIERSGANFLQLFGLGDAPNLPTVTMDTALTVPAVWAAVSFLSRTLAALPLHTYRNAEAGPEKIKGGLQTLIHEAPNPEWTSFKLRQHFWQQVFTGGRGLLYIERAGSNIIGLWPIDPTKVRIKRSPTGQTTYEAGGKVYPASDIIDVPFMLKADALSHYGPIMQGAEVIQLALAMNKYGAKFFAGGGVPPLGLFGPVAQGAEAQKRALNDIQRAIDVAKESGKQIVPLPAGHELKPIGYEPEKGQMTEAQRFQVEQIARLFNLPPVFLQDLTRATFNNSEQQDLHLVKHLVGQWAQALEEEMNLKLFGQRNGGRYVEHNVDGLLRGDFKNRMEGLARSIMAGIRTPNEARRLENLPDHEDSAANDLHMQGATVPIGTQPDNTGTPPPDQGDENDDGA